MARGSIWAPIGVWAYVAGVVVALIVSLFSPGALEPWAQGSLAVLGLVVGILNIAEAEVRTFLIAAIAFILAAGVLSDMFAVLGPQFAILTTFMHAIVVFTAPGALVVSFRALYEVARNR